MADKNVDILIVGGGLIGASLLLALKQTSLSIALIEAHPLTQSIETHFDARSFALAPSSMRLLEQLRIWPSIAKYATPINTIHISEQGRFGHANLEGNPLGQVIEAQYLNQAIYHALPKESVISPATVVEFDPIKETVTVKEGDKTYTIQARLIVAADGADSLIRRFCKLPALTKNYAQAALVANVGLARSHHNIAYERFTPTGALAFLPMSDSRAALVWTLPTAEAMRLQAMPETAFLAQLQKTFGYRLGRLAKVGQRYTYPLRQVLMRQTVIDSTVFIGNAAHTLHPVAGQGFNLGLRDVAMLAQCLVERGLTSSALAYYQKNRKNDQKITAYLTDKLIELFNSQMPGLTLARGMGLMLFDQFPSLKKSISRYAQGLGGVVPDLICGIPLREGQS